VPPGDGVTPCGPAEKFVGGDVTAEASGGGVAGDALGGRCPPRTGAFNVPVSFKTRFLSFTASDTPSLTWIPYARFSRLSTCPIWGGEGGVEAIDQKADKEGGGVGSTDMICSEIQKCVRQRPSDMS
jgi:hypothetical protein